MAEEHSSEARVLRLVKGEPSEADLVEGLMHREAWAASRLYERFGDSINRRIWRLMGHDQDHDDLVHQVFATILTSIAGLKNPLALEDWVIAITLNVVRREIRSRRYRRLFISQSSNIEDLPEGAEPAQSMLLRRFYHILDRMSANSRIVFVLRYVEGLTVEEASRACRWSPATTKRKGAKAKGEFLKRARRDPLLGSLLEDEPW